MFLLTSSDREHGGTVIHGIFSTREKAQKSMFEIEDIDYWRIGHIEEFQVDEFQQRT